ncbi:hypothetical protein [Limimaricola litoreus]|uniref:Uncharacterized protein n=1 Tax=Limimaricola litoreus TaxID=2955316 RepID=A0A9X2JSU3_9RHOB|nr:hypothetical protein [Limimaricola litoreus]MCP1170101.1 hypothetical protein [Limimaricola litoreus]
MFMKSKSLVAATALTVAASGAFAQGQEGLVNVSVDDNTVQVPVDVAANVCDLDVNVLASDFVGSEETACEIDQKTAAQNGIQSNGSNSAEGNNGQQNGLVNLSLDGNTVQAPIGVAANVCDVDANVIAQDFTGTDESVCTISQEQAAENGIDTSGLSDSDMSNATDTLGDTVDTTTDAAGSVTDTATDAADSVTDTTTDAADSVTDTATDAADSVTDTATDTADSVTDTATDATDTITN